MQSTVDLARLFQFGNTPSPAGNGLIPPGGGLPPAPPSAGPGSFMSPYRPPGDLVPRGTESVLPGGEKFMGQAQRVPPTALPKSGVMGGAAATGLPLLTKAAGAAGLALYPTPAGEGSDKPQGSGAPGFSPDAQPTPIAKPAGGLPQVGPEKGIWQQLQDWQQGRRDKLYANPNSPVDQFRNMIGETVARNIDLWRQMTGQPMEYFQPIDGGTSGQPGTNVPASPGGTPLPPGWTPGMPTQIPPVLPMSRIGAGDSTGSTGNPGNSAAPPTNFIEWSGRPGTRQTYSPEQIAQLANRNVVPGLPAQTPQTPQTFDLGQLYQMAMAHGPGAGAETFAQRGERKANKAIAMKLLGDVMGEQGQNWRAQLGETGQNQRTRQTLQEHLLSTLLGQKPTELQFKTFQTKTRDAMGNEISQEIPGVFNPANGQWTAMPGMQGMPGMPGAGQHPFGKYEDRKAEWDAKAKEWGHGNGQQAYDYAVADYMKKQGM